MIRLVYYTLGALMLWIIVDALAVTFIADPNSFPQAITQILTKPMYAPIHDVIGTFYKGRIDFAPLVVLIVISLIRKPLWTRIQFPNYKNRDDRYEPD